MFVKCVNVNICQNCFIILKVIVFKHTKLYLCSSVLKKCDSVEKMAAVEIVELWVLS